MNILFLVVLFGCAGGAGSGGTDGGSDGAGGASGESASASKVCESEEVSVGQSSEKEEDCTTISVSLNLQEDSKLAGITRIIGEAVASGLDNELLRANVVTTSDAQAALTYSSWLQMLGGEDASEVAARVAESYSNADILVVPSIAGDPDGTVIASIAASDRSGVRIAGVTFSGTATALNSSAVSLGKQLAEKIKKARICISLTPVRAVVNFDKEEKRKQEFTASVKDLKNQPLSEDNVSFELDNPGSGSLSAASAAISNGEAKTTFTMTKKQPNSLQASYKGKYVTQTDTSTIIPLCGWLLVIEGDKTFDLNHASPPAFHALFGEGSWITINGTNTVGGHVPLAKMDEDASVFGTGWMVEKLNTSGGMFTYLYSMDGEGRIVGECSSQSTEDGFVQGEWVVWGTSTEDTITIQGFATGIAAGGEKGSAKCSVAGISGSGGGTKDIGALSEFHDITMPLKAGATAEATGQGAFFLEKYKYTLTLKRAAP